MFVSICKLGTVESSTFPAWKQYVCNQMKPTDSLQSFNIFFWLFRQISDRSEKEWRRQVNKEKFGSIQFNRTKTNMLVVTRLASFDSGRKLLWSWSALSSHQNSRGFKMTTPSIWPRREVKKDGEVLW